MPEPTIAEIAFRAAVRRDKYRTRREAHVLLPIGGWAASPAERILLLEAGQVVRETQALRADYTVEVG